MKEEKVNHSWEAVGFSATAPNIFRCRRDGCNMYKSTAGRAAEYTYPDGGEIVTIIGRNHHVPPCTGKAGRIVINGNTGDEPLA